MYYATYPMNVELMTPHFVQDVSHEDAVNVWLRPSVHGGVVHEIIPWSPEKIFLTVVGVLSYDN